jgi:hypothetical protein
MKESTAAENSASVGVVPLLDSALISSAGGHASSCSSSRHTVRLTICDVCTRTMCRMRRRASSALASSRAQQPLRSAWARSSARSRHCSSASCTSLEPSSSSSVARCCGIRVWHALSARRAEAQGRRRRCSRRRRFCRYLAKSCVRPEFCLMHSEAYNCFNYDH